MLQIVHARALAKLGRAKECKAALSHAEDHFAGRDPTFDPPWMAYFDAAQLRGDGGHALFDIAINGDEIEPAIDSLMFAVNHHSPGYARSRAFSLMKTVTLRLTKHDPRDAAQLGFQAVTAAEPLRSQRVRLYLKEMHAATRPNLHIAEVAELRHQVAQVLHHAN